jgi:hypothetical protein
MTDSTRYARRVLVSSSDEKYSPGLIVLIASALAHLPAGFEVDVVIYDEGLSPATRAELERIVTSSMTVSRLRLEPGFTFRPARGPVDDLNFPSPPFPNGGRTAGAAI